VSNFDTRGVEYPHEVTSDSITRKTDALLRNPRTASLT